MNEFFEGKVGLRIKPKKIAIACDMCKKSSSNINRYLFSGFRFPYAFRLNAPPEYTSLWDICEACLSLVKETAPYLDIVIVKESLQEKLSTYTIVENAETKTR